MKLFAALRDRFRRRPPAPLAELSEDDPVFVARQVRQEMVLRRHEAARVAEESRNIVANRLARRGRRP